MNILLTKSLPADLLHDYRQQDWKFDIVEALKITLVDVEKLPSQGDHVRSNKNIWIASSRNSYDTLVKFKEVAPRRIFVVGNWLKEKLKSNFRESGVTSFENMEALASALMGEKFESAFYFCGDNHRTELDESLAGRSFNLTKIITHRSEQTFPILTKSYSAVVIFSPRSAESVLRNNQFDMSVTFACVGSTTEEYLRSRNITNTFCASSPDASILLREFSQSIKYSSSKN